MTTVTLPVASIGTVNIMFSFSPTTILFAIGITKDAIFSTLNVSEFEGIDQATESLVAMSAAYSELEKIDIVDKLNEDPNFKNVILNK